MANRSSSLTGLGKAVPRDPVDLDINHPAVPPQIAKKLPRHHSRRSHPVYHSRVLAHSFFRLIF